MRILEASFSAREPALLSGWYRERLAAAPAFHPGPPGPHHLAFHAASLAPWRERLELPLLTDSEGREEFDFSDWGGARSIYVHDPEGNIAELIARPQARPEATLAEVGLPVPDVAAAVATLERAFGLRHYDGDRETFSAVGDDDGLLIVVRDGRGWYPSGEPTGPGGVRVVLGTGRPAAVELAGGRHRISAV